MMPSEGNIAVPVVLSRLRLETRDLHKAVEARSLIAGLMAPDLTLTRYVACLIRLERFHASLEPALDAHLGDHLALSLSKRRKTGALRRDLAHFGCRPADAGPAVTLTTEAAAWGALYVIEGATLGGLVITRQIARHGWLGASGGRSFFAGYGAETGAMWSQFRAAISQAEAGCAGFADLAVAEARKTFVRLDEILAQDGPAQAPSGRTMLPAAASVPGAAGACDVRHRSHRGPMTP